MLNSKLSARCPDLQTTDNEVFPAKGGLVWLDAGELLAMQGTTGLLLVEETDSSITAHTH
jgi:hypothetical protein